VLRWEFASVYICFKVNRHNCYFNFPAHCLYEHVWKRFRRHRPLQLLMQYISDFRV